jgi:hypothetical protein
MISSKTFTLSAIGSLFLSTLSPSTLAQTQDIGKAQVGSQSVFIDGNSNIVNQTINQTILYTPNRQVVKPPRGNRNSKPLPHLKLPPDTPPPHSSRSRRMR